MNTPPLRPLRGIVAALLLSSCGYSESAMQAQRDSVRTLQTEVSRQRAGRADLEARVADAEARNRTLAEAVRELGGNVQSLTTERRDLSTSLSALEAEQGQLGDSLHAAQLALEELRSREAQGRERVRVFRTMLERFRSMIDAGQLRVRVARNRMVVELPEGVLFDTGRAEIKASGQRVLEQVSEVLRTMGRDFQIAGHTDNVPIHTPRFPSNWELSAGRALTVSHFLLEHGMAAERLSAAGYAETLPAATNDTPEGRQQNRRIEIVLLPALEELPDLSALRELADARTP